MKRPPIAAILLGAAGLLPFVGAALILYFYGLVPLEVENFVALFFLQVYASAILAFMGGCLWGFAAQAGRAGIKELGLAILPMIWSVGVAYSPAVIPTLLLGFILVFAIDIVFILWRLAPPWWLALRLPLTIGVLASLGLAMLA